MAGRCFLSERRVAADVSAASRWDLPGAWQVDSGRTKETLGSISRSRRIMQIKSNIKRLQMKAPKVERCQTLQRALHIPILPSIGVPSDHSPAVSRMKERVLND